MKLRYVGVLLAGIGATVAACSSDSTSPKPAVGPDAASCTVGTLSVGETHQGDFSVTAGCTEPLFWDTSYTVSYQSYNFSVQSGKGYLVSLLSTWDSHDELEGGTAGSEVQLAEADYSAPYQSTLPFVANASTTYSVRVGQDDQNPAADTGAYTLRAQSCKVPVPTVTDSVTHTDNIGPGDCTDPKSDYIGGDSSYIHLYAVHFANDGGTRTITIDPQGDPMTFELGGPGYDPYDYFTNGWGERNISTTTSYSITAPDSGTYTMVLGMSQYESGSEPYTITFGNEVAPALHVTPPPSARSVQLTAISASASPAHLKHKH